MFKPFQEKFLKGWVPLPPPVKRMRLGFRTYARFTEILVNGTVQFMFDRSRFVGVQSYIEDRPAQKLTMFCIEFTFTDRANILIEWDTREKWEQYLKFLEEVFESQL